MSYPADPAQQIHPEIPKGQVLQFDVDHSSIFPGTKRTIFVYIPAKYRPDKPACLYVGLDGMQFHEAAVFDYLITKEEMPVTIGVFIRPGEIKEDSTTVIRYNRSHEFDSMNDDFVRFLLNELLPEIEKRKTSDGRSIRISRDPNDCAIGGASTGGIGAFTTAWQRPDAFSRVFSAIGTFVSMRGGDQYPGLIRKTDPKPIRIFLEDGASDSWNPLFGSWYANNVAMEAALSFAGYEVAHSWGNGGHNGKHADAIFPDVMRWLWKGWPQKVQNGRTNNNMLGAILQDDEPWKLVDGSLKPARAITADPDGEVLLQDSSGSIYRVQANGRIKPVIKINGEALACDAKGNIKLIESDSTGLFDIGQKGELSLVDRGVAGKKLVVTHEDNIYITQPASGGTGPGKIWLIKPGGTAVAVDTGLRFASAITLSADHRMLLVAEDNTNWIYSYVIQNDGSLAYKQRWYWLHQTDNYGYSQVSDMAMDNAGNLYAATNLGVQVCDQNGRVRGILQLPYGPVTGLCFGGPDFSTLFVICSGKLYERKLKLNGVPSWGHPVYPKSAGAG